MENRVRASRPFMPGYGLPEDGASLRPWSWGEEVLRSGHNYWVATVRGDGRPHAMPVWGVWHERAFWFSTGGESRKAKNLAARPECTVGTERAGEAVIVEGRAVRMSAASAPAEVARLYTEKYGMPYPDDSPVFRVVPRVAFGFSEAAEDFAEAATRWVFAES